jgi:hypothetical protein
MRPDACARLNPPAPRGTANRPVICVEFGIRDLSPSSKFFPTPHNRVQRIPNLRGAYVAIQSEKIIKSVYPRQLHIKNNKKWWDPCGPTCHPHCFLLSLSFLFHSFTSFASVDGIQRPAGAPRRWRGRLTRAHRAGRWERSGGARPGGRWEREEPRCAGIGGRREGGRGAVAHARPAGGRERSDG